jgi:16S rRNA (cytosine1402-N4)-methyltransferase
MRHKPRSTPAGEHRPVLLTEVLEVLDLQPGMTVLDCTVGWAGHSIELLRRVGPMGLLIGLDMDSENLPKARERLEAVGHPFHLHHANFAAIEQILAEHGITQVHGLVADLGMSSMQVDDPERGFSYSRDGALDMRMDRTRGRTAAQLIATISEAELAKQLRQIGDEPHADGIASAIVRARGDGAITTTKQLANIIQEATKQQDWQLHPTAGKWNLHPAARTFQTLRILVNRELANLEHLLRMLARILHTNAAAAIISFHSGEDRQVKAAFRVGRQEGVFSAISEEHVRATSEERFCNPRSRSAKMRWGRRG